MNRSNYKLFLIAAALASGILFGCTSSQESVSGEDEFFVPLDSSQVPGIVPKPITAVGQKGKPVPSYQDTSGLSIFNFLPDTGRVIANADAPEKWFPVQQKYQPPPLLPGRYTVQSLKDSISLVAEQVNLLQSVLEASTVDRRLYYHSHVKAWSISNPTLRDSLFYALMAVDSSIQSEAGSDAEVLATENNDLIEVRFGTGVFKGVALKQAMEKTGDKYLYQKVVESNGYSRDIELRDTTFTLPTPFESALLTTGELLDQFSYVTVHSNPVPVVGRADLSLYDVSFRIGPIWGGEVRLGNDELGYPFWSSGKLAFLGMFKQVKAGFELPASFGSGNDINFVLPLRSRLLNGTRGFVGEFDFGSVGGYLSLTRLTQNDINDLTDPNRFYFITQEALGYTSFGFTITRTSWARLKVGVGHHQVREGAVLLGDQIQEGEHFDFNSPYFKLEYLHRDVDEGFGGSFQYYNSTLLTTAWLQIIPGILQIELKYSKPVLRPIAEWENPDFIIVSPKVIVSF